MNTHPELDFPARTGASITASSNSGRPDYPPVAPVYTTTLKKPDTAKPNNDVRTRLEWLKNEINCRREHGAEGAQHLKFIEERLAEIIGGKH